MAERTAAGPGAPSTGARGEAREQLLRDVKEKYVARDSVTGAAVLGGILAVLGGLAWMDRKRT